MTTVTLWVLTMVFSGGAAVATPVPNNVPAYHPTQEACVAQGDAFQQVADQATASRYQKMAFRCDLREVVILTK